MAGRRYKSVRDGSFDWVVEIYIVCTCKKAVLIAVMFALIRPLHKKAVGDREFRPLSLSHRIFHSAE